MNDIVMVKFSDGYYGLRRERYAGHFEFLSIISPETGYWWFDPDMVKKWCKAITKWGCKRALRKYEKHANAQTDIGTPV